MTEADQGVAGESGRPGRLLRRYVLPALQLSVSQAARDLSVTRQTLHRILAGQAAITPEMAVRLERFCGISLHFWRHRQYRHDLHRVRTGGGVAGSPTPRRTLPEDVLRQIGQDNDR